MINIDEKTKKSAKANVTKNFASQRLNPKLMSLIKKNNLTKEEAEQNLSSLEDTLQELNNCANCPGLSKCPNHIKGYVYYPQKEETFVSFNYVACKKLKEYENKIELKDANHEIASARMKDIDVTEKNRVTLIKWLKSFYDKYDLTHPTKGLYLHGSFGSGKTFLLAALLNELKIEKNAKIEIIYFPDLLRELKDNFDTLESKVRYLSSVDILLIDDIGAEKVTSWSRDEILGTILQARMNSKLTTFFTSNLTIDELEEHLALTKDSTDEVKARRITQRIKQLTEDMELISANRRK